MYKVIIADDEINIIQGIKKKVDWQSLGYEIVATASNGLDCFNLIKNHNPDLVISDIRMPGINGLKMLENIRRENIQTQIIFMSGYSEFEYARKALELGAISYLLKPIGRKELYNVALKARKIIEWSLFEKMSRSKYFAEELLEFITAIPSGTKNEVILKRLGLSNRNETFICIAEEIYGEQSIVPECITHGTELCTLRPNSRIWLHVLSLPETAIESFIRNLKHKHNSEHTSIGISEVENNLQYLPRMINEAKNACHNSFVTGMHNVYRFNKKQLSVLNQMAADFNTLFSIGSENKLHKLLNEVLTISQKTPPSMHEVIMFYNTILNLINEYSAARKIPFYAGPAMTDPEEIYRIHTSLGNLIDYLHESVQDLFESKTHGAMITDSSSDLLTSIKQYIRKNITDDLNPENLAAFFNLEKKQLAFLFKSETGKNLTEFIRNARIDHACFLLQHTHISINEVSDLCGFSDYYYFARLFKKEKGVTASDYRGES